MKLDPEKKSGPALIYIVDDEELMLDLVELALTNEGHELRRFSDPAIAFSAFKAEQDKPALLLTDYAMMPINGLELSEKCKANCPDLKILMVSGTVTEEIARGSTVQLDGFIAKPYPAAQLAMYRSHLAGFLALGLTPRRRATYRSSVELRGKKLGVLISCAPTEPGFRHGINLAQAAISRGINVYLYCIDDAVRGVSDSTLQQLKSNGLSLYACAYGAHKRSMPLSEDATFAGLTVVNDIIAGTERFVCFN